MATTTSCLISISCRNRHSGSLYTLTVNANSVKLGLQSSVLRCSSSKSGPPMYYNYTYACSKATGKDLSCHVVGVHSKRSVRSVRVYGRRREEEENEFGMYPWDASFSDNNDEALQWVQEDTITLFTTDGLMQIGGSVVPQRINSSHNFQGRLRASQRYRRFQEENYMDPNQGLCLGAIFDIAATNGLDLGRRFCIFGFCRSIEMLSDMVEDTVLEQGGEVVVAEKESKGGLQEKLTMTVAVPLLWGIPPAAERLRFAVRSGGGIVEKVYWQWNFL